MGEIVRPVITVVGSFAVGLTLRAPRFPVAGETLIGSDFDMGPGGKGSNQAVGAARLGAESHLVAVIGADAFGEVALDLYRREMVDAAHVRRTSERNTGVGFITLNAAGENHIVLDMGANHLLSPEDVEQAEDLIAGSDAVLSVLEIQAATATRAMALARRHHVISILNPAPAQALDDALLGAVDVLTPNESELRILSGLAPDDPTGTLELAHRLQQRGARQLVVTRGSQGALVVDADGGTHQVPGVPVEVVDTTGAGDAFAAGYLVGGVELGLETAARCCARMGATP